MNSDICNQLDSRLHQLKIAIVGLGYVGLPLAVEFGKKVEVIGFDVDRKRVADLKSGYDKTLEVEAHDLAAAKKLFFSDNAEDLTGSNFYIVTVPTPIDDNKNPDLGPLLKASEMLSRVLKKGDIVVFESTVYPGATEEDCVPVLEKSGLKFNVDFYCGYSPERINPGDKEHRVTTIKKVTSGSTEEVAEIIDKVYSSIIIAGTHKAPSIRVAEAAKVIENTQRDVNIALVNELAVIFNKMGIDTLDVLEAAGSKWNFLPFRPGLVGGHCIGIDPYYLTHKAQKIGYTPEIILSGRRLNDGMGKYVASQLVKKMISRGVDLATSSVMIMGFTFKENCPDTRNTRVIDIVRELTEFGCTVKAHDPWADPDEVKGEYGIILETELPEEKFDAIIFAVAHDEFGKMTEQQIEKIKKSSSSIVYDLKYVTGKPDMRL